MGAGWLVEELGRAAQRRAALPKWARPVADKNLASLVTPNGAAAHTSPDCYDCGWVER